MSLSPTARDADGHPFVLRQHIRGAMKLPPRPPRPQLPTPVPPVGPFVRPPVGRIYEWSAWGAVRSTFVDSFAGGFMFTRELAISLWRERQEAREFEQLCVRLRGCAP